MIIARPRVVLRQQPALGQIFHYTPQCQALVTNPECASVTGKNAAAASIIGAVIGYLFGRFRKRP